MRPTKTFIASTLVIAGLACGRSEPGVAHRVVKPAAAEAENPSPAPALREGVYQGRFVVGHETSWFTPCGTDERWWVPRDLEEVTRFIAQSPRVAGPHGWDNARVFLKARAIPSATGTYGHLGKYSRELDVLEVLEVREFRVGDCRLESGA
jgi:hypothetical protein